MLGAGVTLPLPRQDNSSGRPLLSLKRYRTPLYVWSQYAEQSYFSEIRSIHADGCKDCRRRNRLLTSKACAFTFRLSGGELSTMMKLTTMLEDGKRRMGHCAGPSKVLNVIWCKCKETTRSNVARSYVNARKTAWNVWWLVKGVEVRSAATSTMW